MATMQRVTVKGRKPVYHIFIDGSFHLSEKNVAQARRIVAALNGGN